MNELFHKENGGFVYTGETADIGNIRAFTENCRAGGEREVRLRIPAALLPAFEAEGYCTDGVIFEENGALFYNVHLSFAFDGCELLSFDREYDVVLTRTVFSVGDAVSAALRITALGFFEAFVNGKPTSKDKLIPAKSDYLQRDLSTMSYPIHDVMSHRIYYYEYDVTPLLQPGENVLATQIGNGWFGDAKNKAEGVSVWGEKFLLFRLTLTHADGRQTVICSSPENTTYHRSHILECSLYYGEYHNYLKYIDGWNEASRSFPDWKKPGTLPVPHTFFHLADFPADAECGELTPLLLKTYGDHKLYDLGDTAAGWPVIRGTKDADANTVVTLRYADLAAPDASLILSHTGGQHRAQEDRFVLSKETAQEPLHPRLLWHASRYIELTGPAAIERFVRVQTPLKPLSVFRSDSQTLNWFFSAFIKTQQANFHGCVPSDCPHRERLGYTGDGQLTCGAVMSIFDARDAYKKWMRDIRDCQDIRNGHVQHTAPFYGGGGGPGGWGGAAVILPYRYYKFYNDKETLRESYHSMKAYMDYMRAHCSDGIVTHEEPGGWCLGDWCPPGNKILIPEAFVNSFYLAKCADMCAETALILNKATDAAEFSSLASAARDAITRHYFDENTGSFCDGVQGADAFAVELGIGDRRTIDNLVRKYTDLGTFDTGIFGTFFLLKALFRNGYGALAYKLFTNEKEASFYHMMRSGARNIWENWDGAHSLCHPMFGASAEFLFSEILGIRRLNDNAGYENVTIRPADIPALANAGGTLWTPWGRITVIIATDSHGKKNISYFADPGVRVHND